MEKGDAYTVTESRNDFGKLKSGAGWIAPESVKLKAVARLYEAMG